MDFIVTVQPDLSDIWMPDCTWADIVSAESTGKTVSVNSYNAQAARADGKLIYVSDVLDHLFYAVEKTVNVGNDYKIIQRFYKFDSNGIAETEGPYEYWDTSPADAIATDVANGKIFFNSTGRVVGSSSGTEGTPTATKGTVSNHSITVTPSVTNTAGYISGGTKTGTAVTVTASELASGNKAISSNGTEIDVIGYSTVSVEVPTGTARDSSDLTVSGATVNVPAGLYSSAASASVASGTAGTPTATKGTVSNHSITVTPAVTNTTGYITGGTKTGTAVTVSASELVSGSATQSSNGTYDVTNLSSLVVAVPIVTYYTGSAEPSASLGSNGDIYLQTES